MPDRATLVLMIIDWERFKKTFIVAMSLLMVGAGVYGVYYAAHSELFRVQVVEIIDHADDAPLSLKEIHRMAAVPVGEVNLFSLSLAPVEARIKASRWVKNVELYKRFPQTLAISVVFHEPVALFQDSAGNLSYVEPGGRVFTPLRPGYRADLPIIAGLARDATSTLQEVTRLINAWREQRLGELAELSALRWDDFNGFRAVFQYALRNPKGSRLVRSRVWLGQQIDGSYLVELPKLNQVLRYLAKKSLRAENVILGIGKKIVVRTSQRS